MRFSATARVRIDGLDLDKHLAEELQETVKAAAFAMEGEAKLRAPVDTGALRASIHVVLHGDSNRETRMAEAMAAHAGMTLSAFSAMETDEAMKEAMTLPMADRTSLNPGPYEAFVVAPVEYAVYQEYGTHKMPAQPYMAPAGDAVQTQFPAMIQAAIRRAGRRRR